MSQSTYYSKNIMNCIILFISIFALSYCHSKKSSDIIFDNAKIKKKRIQPIIKQEYKEKINKQYKYIAVTAGLNLREEPNLKAKIIIAIPYLEKVISLEKGKKIYNIDGLKSNWFKIIWKNYSGWVFGGYLISQDFYRNYTKKSKGILTENRDFYMKSLENISLIHKYLKDDIEKSIQLSNVLLKKNNKTLYSDFSLQHTLFIPVCIKKLELICIKNSNKQVIINDPIKLIELIEINLQRQKRKKLLEMMLCKFIHGYYHSGSYGYVNKEDIIDSILEKSKNIDFGTKIILENNGQILVVQYKSKNRPENKENYLDLYTLRLMKYSDNQWLWESFSIPAWDQIVKADYCWNIH